VGFVKREYLSQNCATLGAIHDFMLLNALRDTTAAQAAIQVVVTLRNAFGSN
jgi:hypothetical protein